MQPRYEAELFVAFAEGLLTREEAERFREERREDGPGPLEWLREQGRLSEETLVALRRQVDERPGEQRVVAQEDGTATLTGPPKPDSPQVPDFPLPGWDRYQVSRFLGQGAMGQVYLAHDPRLNRKVALKLLRHEDPDRVRRLISEARAQARVSHERVCKVYEVGEAGGKVFIAMQYVDGQPLDRVASGLSVEQKAILIRDAAEGVHEAHRAGLIHRDLKPSNLMVETTGDGGQRLYVMDFGLARDWDGNATLEGSVVGTPHYMSPEQARGEVSRLDRRTDVYALGATLYALLAGQPPIPGENALEIVGRIATEEPRRLRELDPDIPADLEAITLKCLEKDRSARYDSARALAQDLDRFLRDEPVQARSGALALYRLRKRLRKHRMAVSVGAVALALVLVALGWGALQRREAAQRERLARRFTERVERIEAQARYSTLSRLHDTRGDREKIRAGLAELEEEIRGAGPSAAGPGQYAMGRGQLALGDDARARASLESAWAQGFREPRAAYALALVMGHLYQRRLLEVERMRNEEQREFWKREAEQRYRAPALAYLKESGGADVPSAEYVAALVDYYEGRLDKALERLDAVGGHLPWFYEAPALRGDILLARASAGWRRGEHDLARADFEAGRRAYAVAGAIGESDPSVHERLGELEHAALVMELYSQGEVEPQFTRGLAAAERALAALADDPASLALEARLYRSFAEYRGTRGGAEEELLSKAVAAAERAIAAAPEQPAARVELARTYRQWGEHLQGRNQNPGEPLRRALQVSAGFGPDEGGYELWANLGLVHKIWADYQDGAGEDSKEHRDQAIQAFAKAISLDGHTADPLINLGSSYFLRASGPGAGDQEADLEQAAATLEKARLLNPRHAVPYFYLGRVSQQRAQLRRSKGEDPAPELARALEWYRAGIAVSPKLPHLYNSLGLSLLEEAKDAWDRGGHPGDLLESAKAACEQAITVAPKHGHGYNNLGEVLRARAAFQRDEGQDPTAAARAAAAAYAQALQQLPDQPIFWANAARTQVLLADHALEQGGAPGPFLAEASAAIDEALRCNARKPEAHLALAELRSLRARVAAGQGRARIEDYEGAAQSFRKAMELAPQSQEGPLAFGHFCLAWASWSGKVGRDPGPPLAEGLAVANRLVKDRPAWPSALILRANLLLDLAGNAATAGQAFALAGSAARDFTAALRANPNLGTRWRARALLAQRLAAGPQESGR